MNGHTLFLRNRLPLSLLSIICFVFCAGCWDRHEVNDLAIVIGTSVDYVDEETVELGVEIVLPEALAGGMEGGGGGGKKTFVEMARGETVAEARSLVQQKISRRLFWGHNQGILFGEEYVRKIGIFKDLEYFAHNIEARLANKVFIIKGTASEVLKTVPQLEFSAMEAIRELDERGAGLQTTVRDVLKANEVERIDIAIPVIQKQQSGSDTSNGEELLELSGTAAFDDDKMVGFVDQELSRGILWFQDKLEQATVTIDLKENDGKISAYIINAKTRLVPKVVGDDIKITVHVSAEDDIVQNSSKLDLAKEETIRMIEEKLAEQAKSRMNGVLQLLQKEYKTDVVDFGKAVHRKYPEKWREWKKDWDKKFSTIQVDYKINIKVKRHGLKQ